MPNPTQPICSAFNTTFSEPNAYSLTNPKCSWIMLQPGILACSQPYCGKHVGLYTYQTQNTNAFPIGAYLLRCSPLRGVGCSVRKFTGIMLRLHVCQIWWEGGWWGLLTFVQHKTTLEKTFEIVFAGLPRVLPAPSCIPYRTIRCDGFKIGFFINFVLRTCSIICDNATARVHANG